MTDPTLDRGRIEELLRETDCPEEFTRRFLEAMEAAGAEEQLQMLRCQRCRLVECIHVAQRKLDMLDYLRYQLEGQLHQEKEERCNE